MLHVGIWCSVLAHSYVFVLYLYNIYIFVLVCKLHQGFDLLILSYLADGASTHSVMYVFNIYINIGNMYIDVFNNYISLNVM